MTIALLAYLRVPVLDYVQPRNVRFRELLAEVVAHTTPQISILVQNIRGLLEAFENYLFQWITTITRVKRNYRFRLIDFICKLAIIRGFIIKNEDLLDAVLNFGFVI
ncbi:hypothetical protein DDZ14_02660 [Maritimibacter sp. 55A14]|nr:hypothetical protein DDZ14_02660 [Maritimibacter sp. 55A14]